MEALTKEQIIYVVDLFCGRVQFCHEPKGQTFDKCLGKCYWAEKLHEELNNDYNETKNK